MSEFAQRPDETPGQHARRLIDRARADAADPSKAKYRDDLLAAADKMERELEFWSALARAIRSLDE